MTMYTKHATGTASVDKMAEASFTCAGSTAPCTAATLPDARTAASVFFVFAALALLVAGLRVACAALVPVFVQLALVIVLGLIMLPGRFLAGGRQQPES